MDPNFSFQLNLAGVAAAGGKALEEGYYKGTIVDAYAAQNSNGGHRLVLKISNFEGMGNATRTTSITIPSENTKAGLLNVWRAAFESMGYTAAQIDSGMLTINRDVVVNRPAHIYYKPGDRDAGIYDELKLLSPATWEVQKTSFTAPSTSALGASTTPAAAAISTPAVAPQAPTNPLMGATLGSAPVANGAAPQGQTPAALRQMLGMN